MKYSIKIMGVPSRQDLADNLLAMILRDAPDARVELLMDHEYKGMGFNLKRSIMSEVHGDDDFRFVLQEDTVVCRDFYATVGEAYSALLKAKGLVIPMFYANTSKQARSMAKGKSWALGSKQDAWGVCLGGPLSLMQDYVRWLNDETNWPLYKHDSSKRPETYGASKLSEVAFCADDTFSWFLETRDIRMYLACPSLIQHAGRGRSTLGHSSGGSMGIAQWFLGTDVSGLSMDWSKV